MMRRRGGTRPCGRHDRRGRRDRGCGQPPSAAEVRESGGRAAGGCCARRAAGRLRCPAARGRARRPAVDPVTAQLENLANLHNQGILSDEEFAAAKAKALGI